MIIERPLQEVPIRSSKVELSSANGHSLCKHGQLIELGYRPVGLQCGMGYSEECKRWYKIIPAFDRSFMIGFYQAIYAKFDLLEIVAHVRMPPHCGIKVMIESYNILEVIPRWQGIPQRRGV